MHEGRIRCKELLSKIISAEDAASLIKDGMTVATSGFTPSGYPKAVPLALAKQAEEGRKVRINLCTGASVGDELDGALTRAGVIARRLPYQTNGDLRKALNTPEVNYQDLHLSHVPQQVRYGYYGNIDVAIVEACAITEEGHVVPTTSAGVSSYIQDADFVIVELNVRQPKN